MAGLDPMVSPGGSAVVMTAPAEAPLAVEPRRGTKTHRLPRPGMARPPTTAPSLPRDDHRRRPGTGRVRRRNSIVAVRRRLKSIARSHHRGNISRRVRLPQPLRGRRRLRLRLRRLQDHSDKRLLLRRRHRRHLLQDHSNRHLLRLHLLNLHKIMCHHRLSRRRLLRQHHHPSLPLLGPRRPSRRSLSPLHQS